MQYKQGPQIFVRGSDLTDRKKCETAKVTLWREITPFELKCAIQESLEGPNEKQLFDKGNECSLCGTALYEGLQDQTLEEVFEKQKEIIKAKFQKAITGKDQVKADLKVVKMSNCKGIHLFHKQCLENQFESSYVDKNLKCNVCGQLYGV